MQHIINVAFDFDDNSVKQYIEKQAISDVRNQLVADARKHMPTDDYGRDGWRQHIDMWVGDYLDEHSREVVDLAVLTLARRVERRKAWKDALADARAELEGGSDEG